MAYKEPHVNVRIPKALAEKIDILQPNIGSRTKRVVYYLIKVIGTEE